MSDTPTLASLISEAIRSRMAGVRVALPARVESYDPSTQTVDVLPMVRDVDVDADGHAATTDLPVLPDVPVCMPRGGGFFVAVPIHTGDFVQLLVNDRAIDQWRARGRLANPEDLRTHDLSDAVAIPGVYPDSAALSDASDTELVIGRDGSGPLLRLKPNGEIHLGRNAADAVALATPSNTRMQALEAKINELVAVYNAHVHTGVKPGKPDEISGVVQVPAMPGTPGPDVSAAKTRAE